MGSSDLASDAPAPRAYVTFREIDDIYASNTTFYMPANDINPPFDALCFNVRSDRVVEVWVFLVTIKKKHTGTSSKVVHIKDVVKKTEGRFPDYKVTTKYVLVVPNHERWKVQWRLTPGFDPEEVFIQFIDTSVQFEHCRPEHVVDNDV